MPAEREEVGIEALHVNGHVRRRLGRVDDTDRSDLVRPLRDLFDWVNRPQDVRAQGHRHDLRPVCEEVIVLFHFQRAVVVHVDILQHRAFVILHEVPRHVVGVVLHDGADDLVTFLNLPLDAVAVGHEVDRFRRGLGEGNLARRFRLDERGDLLARAFVLAGGLLSELVDRPMDVRVVARIEVRRRVDDLLRLLGCRRAVEVDESLVPDRTLQDREVRLDGRHVQQDLRGFCHAVPPCHDRLNT